MNSKKFMDSRKKKERKEKEKTQQKNKKVKERKTRIKKKVKIDPKCGGEKKPEWTGAYRGRGAKKGTRQVAIQRPTREVGSAVHDTALLTFCHLTFDR